MAFWGAFAAVLLVVLLIWAAIRSWWERTKNTFSKSAGGAGLEALIREGDTLEQETPRSLSGADRLLLPKIQKDFPDFDPDLVKTYARQALAARYAGKESFTVYNVVISRYQVSGAQRTVILQAAASYIEGGRKRQKRYDLHYTYILSASGTVAANCPNCGGALGYGETVCSYCGSRVANPLSTAWKFTEILES